MARTSNPKMFIRAKNQLGSDLFTRDACCSVETLEQKMEKSKHRLIKIRFRDKFLLYMANMMGKFFPAKLWRRHKHFKKLYTEGTKQLDKLFDVVKMMKNTKN